MGIDKDEEAGRTTVMAGFYNLSISMASEEAPIPDPSLPPPVSAADAAGLLLGGPKVGSGPSVSAGSGNAGLSANLAAAVQAGIAASKPGGTEKGAAEKGGSLAAAVPVEERSVFGSVMRRVHACLRPRDSGARVAAAARAAGVIQQARACFSSAGGHLAELEIDHVRRGMRSIQVCALSTSETPAEL